MNDIHNNENISQEEEFVSPGQEKVNGKATPEQSGPSTGEPREQPGEPTEEAVEIEETEEIEIIEAGEFTVPKKEEEEEEIQELHTKHPRRDVPVIDHRLLAGKLTVYDWLEDLPATDCAPEIVEVRFKNTRKGFYSNPSKLALKAGDIVAVEAALGHDIGVVSLSGELVKEQIRIKRVDLERNPLKKVYRKAKPHDIEKWQQAIALEHDTMIRSRKIAADLKLNMKIGDVEYQGDGNKPLSTVGIIFVLLSSLSYAIYIVGVNRSSLKTLPTTKLTFYAILFGLSVYIVRLNFCTELQIIPSPLLWADVLALAILPTAVSLICTALAIQSIGSTPTAILGALEPVTALFFGVLLFHEKLTPRLMVGILMIITAVTLIIIGKSLIKKMSVLLQISKK